MKTFALLTCALLAVLLLSGCVEEELNENSPTIKKCSSDEDCIPKPSCHPLECINKNYEYMFKGMRLCSGSALAYAAYKVEDCGCVKGVCTNLNLGKDATNSS